MNYNFDEPSAVDFDLMRQHLSAIKVAHRAPVAALACTRSLAACTQRGERVDIPHYDFKVHSRTSEVTRVEGVDVVLLEGILVLFPPHVRYGLARTLRTCIRACSRAGRPRLAAAS